MSLPKPYYQDSAVTIYHGDCREILPELADSSADLVLTDPPYVGLSGGLVQNSPGGVGMRRSRSITVGNPWGASVGWTTQAWRVADLGMMVFCSYHFVAELAAALPVDSRVALVTWYKRNSPPALANVPRFTSEFIWLFKKRPGLRWRNLATTVIDIPTLPAGCMASERVVNADGATEHPTQKPTELIATILSVGGNSILDPFAGSGTTLRAAKDLGRKAVGIEIEERYCEIAARRCAQEVMEFPAASREEK